MDDEDDPLDYIHRKEEDRVTSPKDAEQSSESSDSEKQVKPTTEVCWSSRSKENMYSSNIQIGEKPLSENTEPLEGTRRHTIGSKEVKRKVEGGIVEKTSLVKQSSSFDKGHAYTTAKTSDGRDYIILKGQPDKALETGISHNGVIPNSSQYTETERRRHRSVPMGVNIVGTADIGYGAAASQDLGQSSKSLSYDTPEKMPDFVDDLTVNPKDLLDPYAGSAHYEWEMVSDDEELFVEKSKVKLNISAERLKNKLIRGVKKHFKKKPIPNVIVLYFLNQFVLRNEM